MRHKERGRNAGKKSEGWEKRKRDSEAEEEGDRQLSIRQEWEYQVYAVMALTV